MKTFSSQSQLLQLQVIENLLVVHNIDEQTSGIYDLKSGSTDYNEGLFPEVAVDGGKLVKGKCLGDYIGKDEAKTKDEGYRILEVAKEIVNEP